MLSMLSLLNFLPQKGKKLANCRRGVKLACHSVLFFDSPLFDIWIPSFAVITLFSGLSLSPFLRSSEPLTEVSFEYPALVNFFKKLGQWPCVLTFPSSALAGEEKSEKSLTPQVSSQCIKAAATHTQPLFFGPLWPVVSDDLVMSFGALIGTITRWAGNDIHKWSFLASRGRSISDRQKAKDITDTFHCSDQSIKLSLLLALLWQNLRSRLRLAWITRFLIAELSDSRTDYTDGWPQSLRRWAEMAIGAGKSLIRKKKQGVVLRGSLFKDFSSFTPPLIHSCSFFFQSLLLFMAPIDWKDKIFNPAWPRLF